ncbi:hypothetical protein [Methanospirillum sp.]|uniref:hypothetical protein n=1 Tax=Methanospirillum sp. TaxID=45200 RepID=UPI0029847F85|nr:hypothetical protein [Methanospirillum sp.]
MNQNPEQTAGDTIDRKLIESGFAVQDHRHTDWKVSPGIVVREYKADALQTVMFCLWTGFLYGLSRQYKN